MEEGCVTITWEIKNCGLLVKEPLFRLHSPALKIEETEGNTWFKLLTYKVYSGNVVIDICGLKPCYPVQLYEVSFISSCGKIPLKLDGLIHILPKNALFDETGRSNLPNDTLTLCCKMRMRNKKTLEFHLSSVLYSSSYSWNITDISLCSSHNTFIELSNFLLYVSLNKKDEQQSWVLTVKEVPCAEGCISFAAFSVKHDSRIVINKLISNNFDNCCYCDIFIIPNNWSITLQLESIVACHRICREQLVLHSPTKIPRLENVSGAGSGVILHKGCKTEEQLALNSPTGILGHKNVSGAGSCTLGRDFLHLYREGVLSDVTLHAEDPPRSFPAHQTVLAARSPVFRAMFEEESGGGRSVDMAGVDSDTVDRMLVYLYGHSLGDLGWGEASALYRAADKYGVAGLKEECADVLVAGLTPDNACDALVLADGRSDEALMERVVLFILDHEEVASSAQWEELEGANPALVAKVATRLFLRKGKRRRVV